MGQGFGPWKEGLSPAERQAWIRTTIRLAAKHTPSAIAFRGELKKVEAGNDYALVRAGELLDEIPARFRRGLIGNFHTK